MGPVGFAPGSGLDVLPHPHIGLETVNYLYDGSSSTATASGRGSGFARATSAG